MAKIDDLFETLSPDVREIVPFDNLTMLSFIGYVQNVKAAFASIHNTDLVVTPLVVGIFVHSVATLVRHINDFYALQTTFDEEWELDWVIGWQRHKISDVFIARVSILDLKGSFEALGVRTVQ